MSNTDRGSALAPVALALQLLLAGAFAGSAGTAYAQTGEADALRRMAQSEVDAGRLSAFRVVEPYRAVGASVIAPTAQTGETAAAAAQDFADAFCDRASTERQWRRSWLLTVYVHGRSHRGYSCSIPVRERSAEGAFVDTRPFEPNDELD